MASIKYLIQSKGLSVPIYLRLSLGRGRVYKRKTGFTIDAKKWSKSTGFPIAKELDTKMLKEDLKDLDNAVNKKLNIESKKGTTIDGDWLLKTINIHFKRISEDDSVSDLLVDAAQEFIDTAELKRNSKGGTGLSKSRIQGISRLKSLLLEFLGNKKVKVAEVDLKFSRKFSSWLLKDKQYAKSYTLKMIDNLKTVCNDAELNGIQVSSQLKNVKGGKIKNDVILYLSPQEQDKILDTVLESKALINARRWLILGCNIGQRGGDLLKLTSENVTIRKNRSVIQLTQQKTGKHIFIPYNSLVAEIIKDGFPSPISIQKFNEYIKIICKLAGLNQKVTIGKICMLKKSEDSDEKIKRKIVDEYEKWEVMTSHVCRRSYASNLYGSLGAPHIMNITGHSSEKTFLNYIGKTSVDYISTIADFFDKQEEEAERKAIPLKVLRNPA